MTDEAVVDLVVAGAGGGLIAALRAAERGLSVLIVEASAHYRRGNNTAMSTAMLPAAGTLWQTEAGIKDSPDLLVADIMAKTRGQADPQLTRTLADISAPLVSWLAEIGLPVELVTDFLYPGHSAYRCHTIPGRKGSRLLDHLNHQVSHHRDIDMLTPARLVEAIPHDDRGITTVVEYPDGTHEQIPCRALLLATNGYGADPDCVARHIPEISAAAYHGSPESRGDALRIGTALGADSAYLDAYQGHAALAMPAATLVGWATIMHGGIMLNTRGQRFGDETCGYSEYAALLAAQPGATGWLLLDRRIHDECLAFQDFRETTESGALAWAATPEELADKMGLPTQTATQTLTTAQASARRNCLDPFGRQNWEAPLAPPYAAVRVCPALFHTQGGLVVDDNACVLRRDGSAIPGLYASGGAAMGISGHGASGYLAGNGLVPALGLAYIAADHVASSQTSSRSRTKTTR